MQNLGREGLQVRSNGLDLFLDFVCARSCMISKS